MSILPYFVGAVLSVAGVGLGAGGLKSRARVKRALGWPTAKGTISSSELVKRTSTGMGQKGRAVKRESWEASVKYSYEVEGKKYTGNSLGLDPMQGGKARAEALVARYASGSEAEVHYDPADPKVAVLDPRLSASGTQFAIGALALAAGIIILAYSPALAALFDF
ncbi:MAG TPA: DUF3592 domain-containing protein [Rectinemataceae bacterium]